MYRVIVRSRRDANAVKAMLDRFYPNWSIEVVTLGGVRRAEDMIKVLDDYLNIDAYSFNILLLGREDLDAANILKEYYTDEYRIVIHVVDKARVRNARIEHLASDFAKARARIRLIASWNYDENSYIFKPNSQNILPKLSIEASNDLFFLIGSRTRENLHKLFRGEVPENPLVLKMSGGNHIIYSGPYIYGYMKIDDYGMKPDFKIEDFYEIVNVDLDDIIRVNLNRLKILELMAINFIRKYINEDYHLVIPWSGGKDSTTILKLATKFIDRDRITPLYVDTGVEFPETKRYIERISEILKIDPVIEYAGIADKILNEGYDLPTHDNRWCTGLKIEAVKRCVDRLIKDGWKVAVLLGDRDAESDVRGFRPPYRKISDRYIELTPIKAWSTFDVQLYLLREGIPLNELYNAGFYRIGCFICPSLRCWERFLMLNDEYIRSSLEKHTLFKKYINRYMS